MTYNRSINQLSDVKQNMEKAKDRIYQISAIPEKERLKIREMCDVILDMITHCQESYWALKSEIGDVSEAELIEFLKHGKKTRHNTLKMLDAHIQRMKDYIMMERVRQRNKKWFQKITDFFHCKRYDGKEYTISCNDMIDIFKPNPFKKWDSMEKIIGKSRRDNNRITQVDSTKTRTDTAKYSDRLMPSDEKWMYDSLKKKMFRGG